MRSLMVLISLLTIPVSAEPLALDQWAKEQLLKITEHCAAKSYGEVVAQMKGVSSEYSDRIDRIPIKALKMRPDHSDFFEMGEVLFPETLPRRYPMKGAFLLCHDAHEAVLGSGSLEEFKSRIQGLEECFHDGYRLQMPPAALAILKCYSEIVK